MNIAPLTSRNAARAADLHISGISTGFISSLGPGFVTSLYEAIADDKYSFGLVAVDNGETIGFVAFTADLSKLYRNIILRRWYKFLFVLFRKLFNIGVLKRIRDNLLYPSKTKKMNLPGAELLSIAVAREGRGKGIASQLVIEGFNECRRRGIEKVKVLVAAANEPANKLYMKTGFQFVGSIDSHGVLSNVYVADIRKP